MGLLSEQDKQKLSLTQQMGSKNNSVAVQAVNTLKKLRHEEYQRAISKDVFSRIGATGWTNLEREDFSGANLQGADMSGVGFVLKKSNLTGANLRETNLNDTILDEALLNNADFRNANMKEVHLLGACLQHADFRNASLEGGHVHGADFSFSNFQDADLYGAKMTQANLQGANLQGAEIIYTNFRNANLEKANFDGVIWYKDENGRRKYNVTLPDESTMKNEVDLERFTNPNHRDFWRPKEPVAWGDNLNVPRRDDLSGLDLRFNDEY
jgi:uncharacterized protein YjbI with pentapeptide repeats